MEDICNRLEKRWVDSESKHREPASRVTGMALDTDGMGREQGRPLGDHLELLRPSGQEIGRDLSRADWGGTRL